MAQDRYSIPKTRTATSVDEGLRKHMQGVYNRMTVGVLLTALTAFGVSSSPELLQLFLGGPQKWIIMFAPVALVWFGFNPARMSSGALQLSFLALAVLYGISFSVIFLAFSGESIARAFLITSGMFAGLSIYAYTTKRDLSGLRSFSIMGILGVFFMGILGIFVPYPSGMQAVIDIIAILAFSGITAWETQNVKLMYNPAHGTESNSRMAWSAALTLYISFIAIFMHLLSLMNRN
jgi:FtsH-binding integral membrane protein